MDLQSSAAKADDISDEEWARFPTQVAVTLGYVAPSGGDATAGASRMRKRANRLAELASLRGLARILDVSDERSRAVISKPGPFGWINDVERWTQLGLKPRKEEYLLLCGPISIGDGIEIHGRIALVSEAVVRGLRAQLGRDPWPALVVVTLVSMMTRYQDGQVTVAAQLVADAANGQPGEALDLLGRMGALTFPVERVKRAAAEPLVLPDLKATSYADPVAAQDTLGYQPYVDAFARVILHKNTATPLVIAVVGEWGKGKSSFMRFLRKRLEAHGTAENRIDDTSLVPRAITVWFDAWRYNSEERVLAALLETVAQEIQRRFGPVSWLRYRLKFAAQELLNWRVAYKLLALLLVFVLVLPIAATAVYMFETTPSSPTAPTQPSEKAAARPEAPKGQWTLEAFVTNAYLQRTALGFAIAVLFVAWQLLRQLRLPLGLDLNRLYEEKDQSDRLGYRAVFKEEFERRLQQLARMPSHALRPVDTEGQIQPAPSPRFRRRSTTSEAGEGNRIVVFVDDLDRCRPDTIVEVLETIKITLDTPQMIFVLGMDEQYVRTGIYSQYREHIELQEKLYGHCPGKEGSLADTWPRRYLEKIIQLPFRLPEAKVENLRRMLTALAPHAGSESEPPSGSAAGATPQRLPGEAAPADAGTPDAQQSRPKRVDLVEVDTPDVNKAIIEAALQVAVEHDANPRRIKAFVNRCRLGLYLLKSESPDDFDAEVTAVLTCFARWERTAIARSSDSASGMEPVDEAGVDPRWLKLRECLFQPARMKATPTSAGGADA